MFHGIKILLNVLKLVSFSLPTEVPKVIFDSEPQYLVPLNTRVTLTCVEADGILPTMFNISYNGKDPERIPNDVKTIDKFTKDNIGTYICIAFNIIGSGSPHELKLSVTGECKRSW